tara:strand:+ start:38 stop:211 length:174 start_codon:yes stop_codon:yes gene_type:complete
MRKINDLLKPYKSYYAANKVLGVGVGQLHRWDKMDAMVDDNGQVWIKTSVPIKELSK